MDRFKFRIPFYDNENNFLGFKYIEVLEGLSAYNYGTCHHGDPEQCTGLKDKNGKLIYEGDILKSVFSDEKLYEVIWCADCYKLRVFTKSSRKTLEYLGLKNAKTSYEIIGNIHKGDNNENK